jgi:hypothetical protein
MIYQPAIDFIEDAFHASGAMETFEVLCYPINEVVLEHTFDYLMEEVGNYELVYICPGEICCVWLANLSLGVICNIGNNVP